MTNSTEQPAAGRPPLSKSEPTVAVSVTMPQSYARFLYAMDRTTSAAIRTLIREEMERQGGR